METIDLYQIHRWDYDTPIEQTLRALDDAVWRNQIRYLGASSMWAHQFAEALHTSDRLNLERFATMQDHYNLVYREEEREMLPFCERDLFSGWGTTQVTDRVPPDCEHGFLSKYLDELVVISRSDEPTTLGHFRR